MLDRYPRMFGNLRTDKNRKRWSALTCFQAPHKPFLLLSVMDLIAQGRISAEAAPKGAACQTKRKVQIESGKLIAYRSFSFATEVSFGHIADRSVL